MGRDLSRGLEMCRYALRLCCWTLVSVSLLLPGCKKRTEETRPSEQGPEAEEVEKGEAVDAAPPQVLAPPRQSVPFDQVYREARDKNLTEVTFTVRLVDEKSTFRQGEVIRIELAFSSSVPDKFVIDGATYDRSGRLGMDVRIHPEDHVVDPLRDYFAHGGFMGGGSRSMPTLTEEPYTIVRVVNEQLRFDKPGKYRMYVLSHRLQTEGPAEGGEFKTRQHPMASNMLKFEVVPAEAEWAPAVLEDALGELASKNPDAANAAAKRIRYLGTKAAVAEMVRRLGNHRDPHHWDFMFGLVGSPHRALVIEAMEKGLDDSETITSQTYLRILVLMKHFYLHPEPDVPYPGTEDKEKYEAWKAQSRKRDAEMKALRSQYAARLAGTLERKSATSRANAVNTLLRLTEGLSSVPPEVAKRLPEAVAREFHLLTPSEQGDLLGHRWHLFGGPHMLPQLRRLYQSTYEEARHLPRIALERIYELDPEEGRKLVLKEIRNPRPAVKHFRLLFLPDETIPELDDLLAARISRRGPDFQDACLLIERYASDAVLARVKEVYEKKTWNIHSWDHAPLLAYFLRVDPSLGAKSVREALSEAAALKPAQSFYLLSQIAGRHYCVELEKIAVEALDNPNLKIVADASRILGEHGSPAVEEALWRRLEEWYEAHKDRPEDLRYSIIDRSRTEEGAALLGGSLRQALICAPNWFCGPDKLSRIKSLTVLPSKRQQIEYKIAPYGPEINLYIQVYSSPGEWGRVGAAQYSCRSLEAAKKKLAQFPRGTVLVWHNNAVNAETEKTVAIFLELKASVEPSGVVLRPAVPISARAGDARR